MVNEQTLPMATKVSEQIKGALKRYVHRQSDVSVNDISDALRADSSKCNALLSGELTSNTFVREFLTSFKSNEKREGVEAQKDDITKVGTPQSSSTSPIKPFDGNRHSSEAAQTKLAQDQDQSTQPIAEAGPAVTSSDDPPSPSRVMRVLKSINPFS